MPFDIHEFKSVMGVGGLLRDNKFLLELAHQPRGLVGSGTNYGTTFRYLSFFVEGVSHPGMNILTNDVSRYGYGPVERKPYIPNFTNLSLMVRSDHDAQVYHFVHDWQRCVLDFTAKEGISSRSGFLAKQTPYEIGYKDDYAVDVSLTMFADDGKPASKIVFREAFPTAVGQYALDWRSQGDYFKFPVQLTYYDWYVDKVKAR